MARITGTRQCTTHLSHCDICWAAVRSPRDHANFCGNKSYVSLVLDEYDDGFWLEIHYASDDIEYIYDMMEKVLIMKSRLLNPKLVKTLNIHFEISSFWDAIHMEFNFSSVKGSSNVFVYLIHSDHKMAFIWQSSECISTSSRRSNKMSKKEDLSPNEEAVLDEMYGITGQKTIEGSLDAAKFEINRWDLREQTVVGSIYVVVPTKDWFY